MGQQQGLQLGQTNSCETVTDHGRPISEYDLALLLDAVSALREAWC
jgi:hypothetical protein